MNTKFCNTCQQTKDRGEFNVRRASADGLAAKCRECSVAWSRRYRRENGDHVRATEKASYERTKDSHNSGVKRWQEKNPEKVIAIKQRCYIRHRERYLKAAKARYESNPQAAKEYAKQWAAAHPGVVAETKSRWKANNIAAVRADHARRRAQELAATPKWVDQKAILEVYKEAARLTEETGILHHVDHIIPLKGENVCGLHVPWNLRAIPARENISKGNKFIEELVFA